LKRGVLTTAASSSERGEQKGATKGQRGFAIADNGFEGIAVKKVGRMCKNTAVPTAAQIGSTMYSTRKKNSNRKGYRKTTAERRCNGDI